MVQIANGRGSTRIRIFAFVNLSMWGNARCNFMALGGFNGRLWKERRRSIFKYSMVNHWATIKVRFGLASLGEANNYCCSLLISFHKNSNYILTYYSLNSLMFFHYILLKFFFLNAILKCLPFCQENFYIYSSWLYKFVWRMFFHHCKVCTSSLESRRFKNKWFENCLIFSFDFL